MKRALAVSLAVLAVSMMFALGLPGPGRFALAQEATGVVAPFLGAWMLVAPTEQESVLMLGGGVDLTIAGTFGGAVWVSYGRADIVSILPEVYWGWPITGRIDNVVTLTFRPRIGLLFAVDLTAAAGNDNRLEFGFGSHRVHIGFDFGTPHVALSGGVLLSEEAWSLSVGVKCFLW